MVNAKELEAEARKRIAEIDGEIAKLQAEKVRLQQMVGVAPKQMGPVNIAFAKDWCLAWFGTPMPDMKVMYTITDHKI